jgi:hypothetical protein
MVEKLNEDKNVIYVTEEEWDRLYEEKFGPTNVASSYTPEERRRLEKESNLFCERYRIKK